MFFLRKGIVRQITSRENTESHPWWCSIQVMQYVSFQRTTDSRKGIFLRTCVFSEISEKKFLLESLHWWCCCTEYVAHRLFPNEPLIFVFLWTCVLSAISEKESHPWWCFCTEYIESWLFPHQPLIAERACIHRNNSRHVSFLQLVRGNSFRNLTPDDAFVQDKKYLVY